MTVRKYIYIYIWSNYSDLTRPHTKWWFSKGNPLISGKPRLVKYYNLARYIYMAGVQNSRSKGSYKVGPIGIEKLILHLRYEAGPIGNHAVPKLGASIALAWR